MAKVKTQTITIQPMKIEHLTIDSDMQPRVTLTLEAIEEYMEAYQNGEAMPAIEIVTDGDRNWVVDGFHRMESAKRVGLDTITCSIRTGDRADAIWFASSANQRHGIRRTNRDKNRAVMMALVAKPASSLREIADHCGVSHVFVSLCKAKTEAVEELASEVEVEEVVEPETEVEQEELGAIEMEMINAEKAIKGVMMLIDGLSERVGALVVGAHGKFIVGQSVMSDLANAKSGLRFGIPHCECPLCETQGCETCRHTGWVSKRQWDLIPRTQK